MSEPIEITLRFDPITAILVVAYFAIGFVLYGAMLWYMKENRGGWQVEDDRPVWTFLAAFVWPVFIPCAALVHIGMTATSIQTRLDNAREWKEFRLWMRTRPSEEKKP